MKYPLELHYDNYINGVYETPKDYEMNFGFVYGGIQINSKHELMLRPITGDLRKIYLYHDRGGVVTGLQFFGADGDLIYESEYKGGFTYSKFEILLAEGERIIGF